MYYDFIDFSLIPVWKVLFCGALFCLLVGLVFYLPFFLYNWFLILKREQFRKQIAESMGGDNDGN